MHFKNPTKRPSNQQSALTATPPQREPIVYRKGAGRWVFECDDESEQALLAHVAHLAAKHVDGFDHFDAALVGHQIRQRLSANIGRDTPSAQQAQPPAPPKHPVPDNPGPKSRPKAS